MEKKADPDFTSETDAPESYADTAWHQIQVLNKEGNFVQLAIRYRCAGGVRVYSFCIRYQCSGRVADTACHRSQMLRKDKLISVSVGYRCSGWVSWTCFASDTGASEAGYTDGYASTTLYHIRLLRNHLKIKHVLRRHTLISFDIRSRLFERISFYHFVSYADAPIPRGIT